MPNKKLIIIVPGSKTKLSRIPVLSAVLEKFYSHFGVEVEEDAWLPALETSFRAIPAETLVFHWSGGISPFAIHTAAQELERVLLHYTDREIFLFTKSLGGAVAAKVAQNTHLPIKLLVYVATPHFRFERKVPPSVRVINVFSDADSYQRLANVMLYAGLGRTRVPHAQNINIPGLQHSDFNHNLEIRVDAKTQRLFDFYRDLLASDSEHMAEI
ncbi:MAG: alpha/beta hydrolase [Patescibacteria group bacterium]